MDTESGMPAAPEVRRIVEELMRAFNAHDVERIVGLHTPDAVWEDPSLSAPITGRAAIREHVSALLRTFPDFTFEDETDLYVGERGRAAAHWRFSATMTGPLEPPGFAPTGKRATVAGVCVYSFDDGMIARHQQYYDLVGLLEQVGLLPAPESASVRVAAGLQRATAQLTKTLRHAS